MCSNTLAYAAPQSFSGFNQGLQWNTVELCSISSGIKNAWLTVHTREGGGGRDVKLTMTGSNTVNSLTVFSVTSLGRLVESRV